MTETTQQTHKEKLKDLIGNIHIAMLFTHANNEGLSGRPMYTADIDDNGDLWFFTNEYSGKVDDIQENSGVILSYTKPSDNIYVVVKGDGEINNDQCKIEKLWNPSMKAWFPEGLDDPKIALLKVTPKEAEYWNGSSSKLVVAFNVLKAMVTGKGYQDGEHGKISIN